MHGQGRTIPLSSWPTPGQSCSPPPPTWGESAATLAAERATLIPTVQAVLACGDDALPGALSFDAALAAQPATPVVDEVAGFYIIYSSGTTGRPA